MAKLTLNTIGSRYGSVEALNDNFDAIEQALENTFSLDGTSPNALEADLDMNNNDILNAGDINTGTLRINGVLVEPELGLTTGSIFQTYEFIATTGQTSFSVAPATPLVTSITVSVNGLILSPSDLSVSGTNVITPALSAGDEVVIKRYTKDTAPIPDTTNLTFIQDGAGAVTRTAQNKMRDIVSAKDFGAVGDGITNTTTGIQNTLNYNGSLLLTEGDYLTTSITPQNNSEISGGGRYVTSLKRSATGNYYQITNKSGVVTRDLTIDMNGQGDGHGWRAQDSSKVEAYNVDVTNMSGVTSGFISYTTAVNDIRDRHVVAFSTAQGDSSVFSSGVSNQNGILMEDVRGGLQLGNYVKGVNAFAHEYKHNTKLSAMVGLSAYQSGYAFGYGQSETPGAPGDPDGIGVDHCVAVGLTAGACDIGFAMGEADANVVVGLVNDANNRLGLYPGGGYGVNIIARGRNYVTGFLSDGDPLYPVRFRDGTTANTVEVVSHDTAADIVTIDSDAGGRNYVRIVHSGARNDIESSINDASGQTGANRNIISCDTTRQFFGSWSGKYHWRIEPSNATFVSTQNYRFEDDTNVFLTLALPGTTNQQAGTVINKVGVANYANFQYTFGATGAGDYWGLRINDTSVWRVYQASFQPVTDNTTDIGTAIAKVRRTYSTEIRIGANSVIWTSGVGSPEGIITAPVGSIYTRTDGSGGTTLYVKEAGTGNTGWYSSASSAAPQLVVVTGTTQAAVANSHYVLTNVAATTLTLPATPVAGDIVWVSVANGITTNVVARNGNNIQSLAEDLTLNATYASVQLRYINSTIGWIFV